ncbi:vesicle-associated membrane protein 5 [Carettochelys insculpta]|uniref:vesicle-associated membrane protein 5 n=1 Tax=Carettochelys insculpta TaxID=44489 RepID=UPI003EBA104E
MVEKNLDRCQQEAEEVTQIMLDNYSKVLDREGKLADLDNRADELRVMSSAFTRTTKTVARQERWKHRKLKLALLGVLVGAVLLIVLAVVLALALRGAGSPAAPTAQLSLSEADRGVQQPPA